jgi:hypothetical protein
MGVCDGLRKLDDIVVTGGSHFAIRCAMLQMDIDENGPCERVQGI